MRSADAVTLAAPVVWSFTTALGTTVRINSGGGNYTAKSGSLFTADTNFTGGLVYSVGNTISGTADPALYQNERYGTFSYAIPVVNGRYDVRLHFIELYYGRAAPGCEGKRIFSIDLLDTPASPDISNLDICSEVGSSTADPKLSMLNHVIAAVEADFDPATMTLRGSACQWN